MPTKLTLTVTATKKASNFDNNIVNKNDLLQSVYIYNAAALNLNANSFNVKVFKADESSTMFADATYDAKFDRLAFTNANKDLSIELPNIARIEFTKV